jgi:acetylserotonin N-methyltransferase
LGVARNGDFADVHRLLDVAGGSGCFCIALATRYPKMHFAVMELPAVCKLVEQYVADYGLQGQIETVAANMFTDPRPSGYDGVFFSNIFHDWDRASCLHLAKRSFEMLPPGGRIFLHEILLNDTKDGPLAAAAFSMSMFQLKGKQYTARELDELLQEAGFTGVTVNPTYAYFSLVSASKPV